MVKNPFKREPDFYVGDKDNPYLLRWWIIPRNRYFNIYLHKFLRDDEDRALHDHPWKSLSIILKGKYIEHTPNKFLNRRTGLIEWLPDNTKIFNRFSFIYRGAGYAHRIELIKDTHQEAIWTKNDYSDMHRVIHKVAQPVWTLFITGRKIREWGFHCPKGWRHWKDFVDPDDHGAVGPGCAE